MEEHNAALWNSGKVSHDLSANSYFFRDGLRNITAPCIFMKHIETFIDTVARAGIYEN